MKSLWIETTEDISFQSLEKDITTDVCIIGAGITGITTAYLLKEQGISFALLEKDKICSGVTAYTTGKITSQHGLFYSYLLEQFGENTAKGYLKSNEDAINSIQQIVEKEKIDCDFEKQNAIVYTNKHDKLRDIKKEVEVLRKLNFPAKFLENVSLPFNTLGGIEFENQAQFNSRKYCIGLIKKLNQNSIFENSKVIDIEKDKDGYKTICENGRVVKSKYVVIASHYPILNFPGFYFLKMYQDKSYIIAVDTKQEVFDGMYYSADEPVTSFRTAKLNDRRLLLVGGSGHKTGDTSIDITSRYKNLENYIRSLYPKAEVLYKWTTEDCVTLDKIPYIGQFSSLMPNVFVATGFKKWGMSSSLVAAKIISNEIAGVKYKYADIYKATRFGPIKNGNETGNMLKQTGYSLFLNRIKTPILSYDELKVGEGGVVSYKGKKLGIYKKSKDEIIAVKPYCTHLGCELSWNPLEKTWDCPCHGSRFNFEGKLLTEPSKKDLEKVDLE